MKGKKYWIPVLAALSLMVFFIPHKVSAHCDTMDGPVVKAAQKALETGDVTLVLIWVQKKDEGDLTKDFEKTLPVRKLGPEAKGLADMYFFETLVRIHRAGEGAPYTGLKPAGQDLGPAIPAADKAIATGDPKPLLKLLNDTVHEGLHAHFKEVMAKKNYKQGNVKAGREYVGAYVPYIHYVERIYDAAKTDVHGHFHEAGEAEGHTEAK